MLRAKEETKFGGLKFNFWEKSALEPLNKVLENLKSNKLDFGRFLSSVEKFEEKQTQTSAIFKPNWISEFPQNTQMLRSLHLKIFWVLDQTPINKVVDDRISENFVFGRFWSLMEKYGEKPNWKSDYLNLNWNSGFQ